MGRKKNASMENVLMVCGIGMISLFVGVILWGIADSFLTPDITVEKPVVTNVSETVEGKTYEIVFEVKNDEKKSVKAEFKIKLGFDVYRTRHSSSPKRSLYRTFQTLHETSKTVVLTPNGKHEVPLKIEIGQGIFQKFQITPETEVYPRVTVNKTSWESVGG